MARNIGRGLDLLAGEASKVLYGERARKDALLRGHLARSQERYLQDQKMLQEKQITDARLKNRMDVQQVADESAMDRERVRSETDIEVARIRGKYGIMKQDKYYWLRNKGVPEKYIQLLDAGTTMYERALRTLATPDPYGERTLEEERLYRREMERGREWMTEGLKGMGVFKDKEPEKTPPPENRNYWEEAMERVRKNKIGGITYPGEQGSKNDWPQYEE